MFFRAYTYIVRLQVLICYLNTRLQRPGMSLVSDPRNVLRHKQGRLTL